MSDIYFLLCFFFRFRLEILHFYGIYGRQFILARDTEIPEEFLRRTEEDRASRGVEPSQFPDQIIFHQTVDRMIGIDAADPFDFGFRHGLLVGDDGKRLKDHVGEDRLLRRHLQADEIVVEFLLGAHLAGIFQTDDPHAVLRLLVFFNEPVHQFLHFGLVDAEDFGNPRYAYRLARGKQDRLDGRGQVFIRASLRGRRRLRFLRRFRILLTVHRFLLLVHCLSPRYPYPD